MKGVSFIIPAYNEAENIGRCIRSIQSELLYYNIPGEIIVVDNNCTDDTSTIAKFEGAIVVEESRKGVVFARQKGYETAKYDLIANIDADSYLPSGWIMFVMEYIYYSDIVAVTGPLLYYDTNMFLRGLARIYYFFAFISNSVLGVFLQGGNCVIKKVYLDKLGGYDTSIPFYGEDTMTAKRLEQFGKIQFVFGMKIYSSARRLQKQGVIKTTWLYFINYLSVTFKGTSHTKDYEDYR